MDISDLTCNYAPNPLGLDDPGPRFSWILKAQGWNQRQSAYRIVIARERQDLMPGRADLWDSDWVSSSQSIHVEYRGKPLASRTRACWRVQVADGEGRPTAWSAVSWFEIGLIDPKDWSGWWIGHPAGATGGDRQVAAPLFRTQIALDQPIKRARAYVSGLGYYELSINGTKVGDGVLSPGYTRYDRTVLYRVYDIGETLAVGPNVIGMMVGNGFYNQHAVDSWNYQHAEWRDQPKCLVQIEVTCANGERKVWTSGPDWQAGFGPIVFDGIRNGEWYDARRECRGWNRAGFDASDWTSAVVVRPPGGVLRSEQMPPIRVVDTLRPTLRTQIDQDTWVVDLGQNISGWARIQVEGDRGQEIILKYGETLDDAGRVDNRRLGEHVKTGEFQTDHYFCKGDGAEIFEPHFVYHGFQYVEISGIGDGLLAVEGRVVHTDLESRGEFVSSNPLLNKIQHAARWSTLTNYHSIPTDCPHREKNGWTGDAALSAEQVLLNFDPRAAYDKWMQDVKDAQRPSGQLPGIVPSSGWGYNWGSGPAWDSALFLIPWNQYVYAGDASLLAKCYASMQAYLRFAESMAVDGMVRFGLGDWCPPIGRGGQHQCPTQVTDTASVYQMATIMICTAEILGQYNDVGEYQRLAESLRLGFRRHSLDSSHGRVLSDCQTALASALYHDLVVSDDGERARVLENLVALVDAKDGHIDTGILGAKYVMHALTANQRTDVAYRMATQTTFPGWDYEIEQGATTLWERWDGTASRNHHMYSDISAWFYQALAGINPDPEEPGFAHVRLLPNPVPGLAWVRAKHRSVYGMVACGWVMDGDHFRIDVEIPVNCRATLTMPPRFRRRLRERGFPPPPEIQVGETEGNLSLEFGSGLYHFEIERSDAP